MEILRKNQNLNIPLNLEDSFKTDLGWSDNLKDLEDEIFADIINPIENYETIRYIHKPYSGITTNPNDTQSDIWFYFYFISGTTYVQDYAAVDITPSENASLVKQTSKSFFRLEFYKTPDDDDPTRSNRRFVFAKNLSIPLGEKYFYTGEDINDYLFAPVFTGSNYRNKENMYLFWFLDDSAFSETTLTGNTFFMTAKFFNAGDGTIIDFTNKDLSVDNSGLTTELRGKRTSPIKFYQKGISGGSEIVEQDDLYYKVIINRTDYSYQVYYET
jgi:hypothetical protein